MKYVIYKNIFGYCVTYGKKENGRKLKTLKHAESYIRKLHQFHKRRILKIIKIRCNIGETGRKSP